MSKKFCKWYKTLVVILGTIGCLGSLYIAYARTSSVVSLDNSNIQVVRFFRMVIISWLIILSVCLLLYGVGIIIEMLQSINDNILSPQNKDDKSNIETNNRINNNNFILILNGV